MHSLLRLVGDRGRYQKRLYALMMLLALSLSWNNFSLFYIFYPPNYECFAADSSTPFVCDRQRACSPGQAHRLSSGSLTRDPERELLL